MVKRSLIGLALLFVAGAWEDILPGLEPGTPEHLAGELPPSDADQDAGDGFVLSQVVPEAVLQCEIPSAPGREPQYSDLDPEDPAVRDPLILSPIPHVPISARHA